MFLKYISDKLNLKKYDNELMSNEISSIDEPIDGLYEEISKYFSLVNYVDVSRLSGDMKKQYEYYFSLSLDELNNENIQNVIYDFLEKSYKILLFPNIQEKYCFYGPLNYRYVAPRDCVVLGLNYNEFDIPDDNFDDVHSKNEQLICDISNYIQENSLKETGINIAILQYNEFSKKKVR
jgi:hypothetical protein